MDSTATPPPQAAQTSDGIFSNFAKSWVLAIVVGGMICCLLLWIIWYLLRKKRTRRRKENRRRKQNNRHVNILFEHTVSSNEQNAPTSQCVHFEHEYNAVSCSANVGHAPSRIRQTPHTAGHGWNEMPLEGDDYLTVCNRGLSTEVISEATVESSLLEQSYSSETSLRASSIQFVRDKQLPVTESKKFTHYLRGDINVPFYPKKEKRQGHFIPDDTFVPHQRAQPDDTSEVCIDDILGEDCHKLPSTKDIFVKQHTESTESVNEGKQCEANTMQKCPTPCNFNSLSKCEKLLLVIAAAADDDDDDDDGDDDLKKMYPKQ